MDNKARQKNDIEINLIPILKVLLSRLWLMVLVGLVVGVVAFGATKLFIKPSYRCSFTAYVNNQHAQADTNSLANSDLLAAQQITKTFSYIIQSNSVLSASLEMMDSDLTYKEVRGMVSTEIKEGTELISVFVADKDSELAYKLADAIAKTAPKYMAEIVEGSSMKIVDYPERTDVPYKPNYLKYGVFGFIAGFLLIVIVELVRFFRDDTIKDESELEMRFSIPVLGIIPDINQINNESKYYEGSYGYSQISETERGENALHE